MGYTQHTNHFGSQGFSLIFFKIDRLDLA